MMEHDPLDMLFEMIHYPSGHVHRRVMRVGSENEAENLICIWNGLPQNTCGRPGCPHYFARLLEVRQRYWTL